MFDNINAVHVQKFNAVKKIKNMFSNNGKVVNSYAKALKTKGYNDIYYRNSHTGGFAMQGLDALGNSRLYLLHQDGKLLTKANTKEKVGENTKQVIDKSVRNFDPVGGLVEYSGKTKTILRGKNNNIVNVEHEQRGYDSSRLYGNTSLEWKMEKNARANSELE